MGEKIGCRYKSYDGKAYDGRCSFFEGQTVLPQEVGWFVLIGLAAIVALIISFLIQYSHRFMSADDSMIRAVGFFSLVMLL